MSGSYFGLLGAFIGVIAVPGRRLPQMAIHDLPGLVIWTAALALTAYLTIAGLSQLRKSTAGAPATADPSEVSIS